VAKEVRPGIVVGTDGKEIDFDLLVMTPPHGTAKFLQGHAIADERGWIKTDPGQGLPKSMVVVC
jgi:NADPH-dependent 2,4-dienoyl-CoA reductase/sulfur reductase-like enzyme